MTREEAITIIRSLMLMMKNPQGKVISDGYYALEMAIQALEQEPKTEPCDDCISRKALLEEIENGINAGNYEEGYEEYAHINDMEDIIECIKYADKVQPKIEQEPKTDYMEFAEWVARKVFSNTWDLNKDAFAEIACRKLAKLGMVEESGDSWVLKEGEAQE